MGEFKMPSLGADMDAGTVTRWLVKPGDVVHRGDIVAVVETEKSTMEVEIFEAGVVEELVVPEGERVPVGAVLARIAAVSVGEAPVAPATAPAPAPAPAPARPKRKARGRPDEVPAGTMVSPVVRHLAERLGVDVHRLAGTGVGGAVTRADVEHAAARHRAEPAPLSPGAVPPGAVPPGAVPPGAVPPGAGRTVPTAAALSPSATGVRSSPLARRVATERGLDIAALAGSGPGGAVTMRDVAGAPPTVHAPPAEAGVPSAALEAPAPSGAAARQMAMRRAIGALMARSKREIPHYYLSTTIDMGRAGAWLEETNAGRPVAERLVASVLLIKAAALAVASVPEMNGFMVGDRFEPSADVHVGVAISLRTGGVIAPAIHHADRLTVDELMAALRDLVTRTRKGVVRSSEMSDPTITVTNLGDLGVDSVFGVIYPPQVALVGFGRVGERPVAVDGLVGVRPCVTATLSGDHRASDGHRGGRFLAAIDHLLQRPEEL